MGFLDDVVLSELGLSEADKKQLASALGELPHITATIIQEIMPRVTRVLSALDMLAQRLSQKGTEL